MINIWHDISPKRIRSSDFMAVIEIEKGSNKKHELDKETGLIMLDRILSTATHYPANYGFIPRTYAEDNDPLDVLVLCSEAIEPLTLVRCYPIGVLSMLDGGEVDEKIIAVPFKDMMYNFFKVYKELENKETAVGELGGEAKAVEVIDRCIDRYIEKFCR